ncbi:MAG: haloacid dehalogenase [Dehalococcoidales bacterium]|nr:haloacid dehalogenase [Dehalococcoidales bacterium]
MEKPTDNLDSIAEGIRESFSALDEARERVIPLCREVIRYSSTAIRALHRQEFEGAAKLIASAREQLDETERAAGDCGELRHTGFFRDAQKEFAEANITLALVTGSMTPRPEELKVSATAYLNGLGEAVGELRRYLLDSTRRGDLERLEELLMAMDDIYNILVTMDFPDAITGGLRRTTDMVRGILERTRSDLTLLIQQNKLEQKLRLFEDRL